MVLNGGSVNTSKTFLFLFQRIFLDLFDNSGHNDDEYVNYGKCRDILRVVSLFDHGDTTMMMMMMMTNM